MNHGAFSTIRLEAILRGGLKHFRFPSENERVFYWKPEEKILYPIGEKLDEFDEFEIVEANITTGHKILETIRELKLPKQKIKVRGNAKTEFGKKFVDIPKHCADPDPQKVLIAFSGKSASLKSFLSHGLKMVHGIPVIKIGQYLQKIVDVGNYGERLFKEEQKNPYLIGEMCLHLVQEYLDEKVIIIDGIKSYETATFLSYATRRPIFIFFVELSEELRRRAIELRADSDDYFAEEREEMFKKNLEKLKDYAYGVLNMEDWQTMKPLSEVLEGLNFKTTTIIDMPNPFGSKRPFLELYRRNVEKLIAKMTKINQNLDQYIFHRNYPERLKKRGISLSQQKSMIINLLASAFRIIDDFLDEHEIREGKPSLWRQEGVIRSIYYAILMTVKAYEIATEEGLSAEFLNMFRRVISGVFYELEVEDGIKEYRTYEDWLKAAEREVAFREFLAYLGETPENVNEFKKWGIKAQIKDDLLGAQKGGRKNTEIRLNRPLFKREWLREVDTILHDVDFAS